MKQARKHIKHSYIFTCDEGIKKNALYHDPAQEVELWHMPQKPCDPGLALLRVTIVSINLTSSPHILVTVPLVLGIQLKALQGFLPGKMLYP